MSYDVFLYHAGTSPDGGSDLALVEDPTEDQVAWVKGTDLQSVIDNSLVEVYGAPTDVPGFGPAWPASVYGEGPTLLASLSYNRDLGSASEAVTPFMALLSRLCSSLELKAFDAQLSRDIAFDVDLQAVIARYEQGRKLLSTPGKGPEPSRKPWWKFW